MVIDPQLQAGLVIRPFGQGQGFSGPQTGAPGAVGLQVFLLGGDRELVSILAVLQQEEMDLLLGHQAEEVFPRQGGHHLKTAAEVGDSGPVLGGEEGGGTHRRVHGDGEGLDFLHGLGVQHDAAVALGAAGGHHQPGAVRGEGQVQGVGPLRQGIDAGEAVRVRLSVSHGDPVQAVAPWDFPKGGEGPGGGIEGEEASLLGYGAHRLHAGAGRSGPMLHGAAILCRPVHGDGEGVIRHHREPEKVLEGLVKEVGILRALDAIGILGQDKVDDQGIIGEVIREEEVFRADLPLGGSVVNILDHSGPGVIHFSGFRFDGGSGPVGIGGQIEDQVFRCCLHEAAHILPDIGKSGGAVLRGSQVDGQVPQQVPAPADRLLGGEAFGSRAVPGSVVGGDHDVVPVAVEVGHHSDDPAQQDQQAEGEDGKGLFHKGLLSGRAAGVRSLLPGEKVARRRRDG